MGEGEIDPAQVEKKEAVQAHFNRDGQIDILIETPELTWRDILYEVIKGMDPWDINLSELATRYAQKVEEMTEMNFRIPANVVLVSAVLLRMKADVFKVTKEDPFMDGKDAFDFVFNQEMPATRLEREKREYELQAILKPTRTLTRRVSADELIGAIQKALDERTERKYRLENKGGVRTLVVATDFDITEIIEEVYGNVMEMLKNKECALFSELAQTKDEMIRVFTSILHLSNKQRLSLRQERIYEELYIHHPAR